MIPPARSRGRSADRGVESGEAGHAPLPEARDGPGWNGDVRGDHGKGRGRDWSDQVTGWRGCSGGVFHGKQRELRSAGGGAAGSVGDGEGLRPVGVLIRDGSVLPTRCRRRRSPDPAPEAEGRSLEPRCHGERKGEGAACAPRGPTASSPPFSSPPFPEPSVSRDTGRRCTGEAFQVAPGACASGGPRAACTGRGSVPWPAERFRGRPFL